MKKWLFSLFFGCLAIMPAITSADNHTPPKTLIVYFSQTGNTDYIARELQKKTGADIFRIETVTPYPAEYKTMTSMVKEEQETGKLPALKRLPEKIATYDLILVGSPVWWYTVSTPVMSMLKQIDFQGKKAAAFCTHGGNPGTFFTDFQKQAKNAVVLDGYEIYKPQNKAPVVISESLDTWLGTLQK